MAGTALSRTRIAVAGVLMIVVGACSLGCSPGIKWRGATYDSVHADSVRNHKLTLVYFRSWAKVECTDFEENVLKAPEVREALSPDGHFYCVPLDSHWDRSLAEQFGVDEPPTVVIVDDDGRVLSRLTGKITVKALLDALHEASSRHDALLKRVDKQ